ncbi:MAG: sulfite exporter TauE/SafE family protein [Planctomycetaceae bacterium]|jgi:uncharacterized membrane protein YfcA|nr:sulfite exporter TauE/SafE family protein [Planctomycetaceae bacterium]
MNNIYQILLIGVIVFVTHLLEGITGFGCTVLALPFVTMILGIKEAVPVLAVLAWILAGYVVMTSRKKIVWKEYIYIVLHVGAGLPLGMFVFQKTSPVYLKFFLAIFMMIIGINGLCRNWKKSKTDKLPETDQELVNHSVKKNIAMSLILFFGGLVHGAFAGGGPFVVVYASKALRNKSLFRVSLCMLWLTMNSLLMIQYTATNVWTQKTGVILLIVLPFLAAGMLIGDFLHHRVNDYYFRLSVYGTLAASGGIMLYDGGKNLLCVLAGACKYRIAAYCFALSKLCKTSLGYYMIWFVSRQKYDHNQWDKK